MKPQNTVLFVDPNTAERLAVSEILAGLGFAVVPAVSGLEALELLEGSSFDLVLLDARMPVLNGFEVLAQIQKSKGRRGGPVVIFSDSESLGVDCLLAGADHFLLKPLDVAKLSGCLTVQGPGGNR